MIHNLYIALCSSHPKSNHFLSPYIWPPLPFTLKTNKKDLPVRRGGYEVSPVMTEAYYTVMSFFEFVDL